MLHIVNKSPLEKNALDSCLTHAQAGSTILLIEDGVYAVTKGNKVEPAMKKAMESWSAVKIVLISISENWNFCLK